MWFRKCQIVETKKRNYIDCLFQSRMNENDIMKKKAWSGNCIFSGRRNMLHIWLYYNIDFPLLSITYFILTFHIHLWTAPYKLFSILFFLGLFASSKENQNTRKRIDAKINFTADFFKHSSTVYYLYDPVSHQLQIKNFGHTNVDSISCCVKFRNRIDEINHFLDIEHEKTTVTIPIPDVFDIFPSYMVYIKKQLTKPSSKYCWDSKCRTAFPCWIRFCDKFEKHTDFCKYWIRKNNHVEYFGSVSAVYYI